MWLFFAILSSIFAALTAIFAKVGIEGVNLPCDGYSNGSGSSFVLGNGLFDPCR